MRRFFLWWNSACGMYLHAALLGVMVTGGFLLLAAWGMTLLDVPRSVVKAFALLAVCAGGFAAGLRCGKRRRRYGIRTGAICGSLVAILVFAIGAGCCREMSLPLLPARLCIVMLSGAAGGVYGVNVKLRHPIHTADSQNRHKFII